MARPRRRPPISRRSLLKTAAAVAGTAAGTGTVTGFPLIWAQKIKDVVLRHAGAPVTVLPPIAEQADKDLGFTVQITFFKYLVGRHVLQAIPLGKVKDWDKTIPVFTKGEYPDGRKASRQDTAPYNVLYATDAGGQPLHEGPTEWLTGVSTITHGGTLGIRPDLVGRKDHDLGRPAVSQDFKGKAALQEQPTIGVMDTALALEALSEIKYGDKGNMTKMEIDKTFKIMTEFKGTANSARSGPPSTSR